MVIAPFCMASTTAHHVWHFEREELVALAHETAENGLAIGEGIELLPKTSASAIEPR